MADSQSSGVARELRLIRFALCGILVVLLALAVPRVLEAVWPSDPTAVELKHIQYELRQMREGFSQDRIDAQTAREAAKGK